MIDTEGIPADVAAAFAVTDTGRSLDYKPDPEPVVVKREPPPFRPWDVRIFRWVDVTMRLCSRDGLIVVFRQKALRRVMRILRWFWRKRLWLHQARLYWRWKRSARQAPEVSADLLALCRKCEEYHVVIDSATAEEIGCAPGDYCNACGCGLKTRALIEKKLERKGYKCPEGLHPGTTVDPYARAIRDATCGGKKQRSENHGDKLLPGNGRGGRAGVQVPSRRHARR